MQSNDTVQRLVAELFLVAAKLTEYTGRPFTLDGHTIGSIGEVYAKTYYGVELYPPGRKDHDGRLNDREVQIKATQRDSVDLKGPSDLLLVFLIRSDGTFKEIYNGDGKRVWDSLSHKKLSKSGEISISLKQLQALPKAKSSDIIPRIV
ncbi:MAG: hypothetical protein V1745_04890 [Patescibacteria group bacterium]